MKTINIAVDNTKLKESSRSMIEISDRQPCWYADLVMEGEDREDAQWKVGLKDGQNSHDYAFDVTRAGDVHNDEFWARATSADFAVELLRLYRTGGQDTIKNWVRSGCPE